MSKPTLRQVLSPAQQAAHAIREARRLGGEQILLAEKSLMESIQLLEPVANDKDGVYTAGVQDRVMRLRETIINELEGLRRTQGWPKQAAQGTAAATAAPAALTA